MAKIALELERAIAQRAGTGTPGKATARPLATGSGWRVDDVICNSGPQDRPFEEQHSGVSIAIVVAGSFQYRASTSRRRRDVELMTPGSLLLGNTGQCFECGHEHGVGDRCLAFHYSPEYFDTLMTDAGVRALGASFPVLRVPPLRAMSPVVALACGALKGSTEISWEEISLQLAVQTLRNIADLSPRWDDLPPAALARVTQAVRMIERDLETELRLSDLAQEAGLSPYHFLRIFERLTGVTPHQFVLRARLRQAAMRLTGVERILDVALDSGFGDVSNFNRAFRREFGISPRLYRAKTANSRKSSAKSLPNRVPKRRASVRQ